MADRYWVGGTGNWSDTARWSTSSGGSSGASVPTTADNVIFDANSNTLLLPFTVTVDGTVSTPSQCLGFTASGLDGAMTLAFGSTGFLECFGSMTFQATNFSVSNSGSFTTGIIFSATTTGNTFTTNGVTVGSSMNIIFAGAGGEWTLGSALTTTSGLVDIRNGSFKTGNYNITCNTLSSTSTYSANTRAITLGSSTISLTGAAAPLTMFNGGTLTFNAGTSTITFSNASPTMAGGGETFYNVSFTATGAGTVTITGANTFNNFTQTSRNATGTKFISLAGNQTVSGTLTLGAANTAIRRIIVLSSVIGTQRTITLNGTLAALADVDFRDINASGTVGTPWTGTRLGNCLGNANITFDAAKTVYWNLSGTQNWSATGWATTNNGAPAVNNFPLAQDTATFTEAGAAGTVTIDAGWNIGNIQMADGVSNRTTAFTFATGTAIFPIYGNVTLFSSLTLSGTGRINFNGQGSTKTITSAGISFTQPFTFEAPSGAIQLLDNLSNTNATGVTLTQGTLDLSSGNRTLTCVVFTSSNSNTRAIAFGTGNITVTGNNATVINIATSTNLTYTGTPTVNFNYSGSTGTRTLTYGGTGGIESNALNLNVTAGSDTVTISNSSAIDNLNFTGFTGTLSNNTRTIYGNLIIPSGMTLTAGTSTTTFAATSGTQELTTNGKTLDFPITVNGVGGTTRLEDNLTMGSTRSLTLTNGTLNANDKNVTCGSFISNNANTRVLTMGSGTWTIQNNGTSWDIGTTTGMTLNRGTSTITMTSTSAKTFAGGGLIYYILNQGGSGDLTLSGANTFYDFTNTVQPSLIAFPASTTTTFNNFSVGGTAGNLVSLRSSSSGTRCVLSIPNVIDLYYLNVQDCEGALPDRWFVGTQSVDSGNNFQIYFTTSPVLNVQISGSGAVTGSGLRARTAVSNITGNGAVSAACQRIELGSAFIDGSGLVNALGAKVVNFSGAITGSAELVALGKILGEEWSDISAEANTWTDSSISTEVWTEITSGSSQWQ
jgi:hypothetical protein